MLSNSAILGVGRLSLCTQSREGIKMPENLRVKPVTFAEIAQRALAYSKANKRSHSHDKQRMVLLTDDFGNRIAEDITRADIRLWLDSKAEEWTPATRNRYLALIKLTYRLAEDDGLIKINPTRGVKQSKETGVSVICRIPRKRDYAQLFRRLSLSACPSSKLAS